MFGMKLGWTGVSVIIGLALLMVGLVLDFRVGESKPLQLAMLFLPLVAGLGIAMALAHISIVLDLNYDLLVLASHRDGDWTRTGYVHDARS